jgi:hypothetical protein
VPISWFASVRVDLPSRATRIHREPHAGGQQDVWDGDHLPFHFSYLCHNRVQIHFAYLSPRALGNAADGPPDWEVDDWLGCLKAPRACERCVENSGIYWCW